MKKIVFLGSKPIGAACLQYLLEMQSRLSSEVIAVSTTNRKEFESLETVEQIAQDHQIRILSSLDEIPECDIIYSVQHHEILKRQHIRKARSWSLNLHLAPLPEYRGCNQFSFAIMDEARSFGVSIHRIDERIDHGALLFEKRFSISPDIWVEDLYQKSVNAGIELFKETLPVILSKDYQGQAIDIQGRRSRIYYRKDIQALKHISVCQDEHTIDKQIRATSMPGFEPPYTLINGEKIYLIREKNL